jgi:hypothetical protein
MTPGASRPEKVRWRRAQVELASGVPFISDADLNAALDEAHLRTRATNDAIAAYEDARIDGLKAALAVLALITILAIFLAGSIPTVPPGQKDPGAAAAAEPAAST